jgi:hypothetical protein
LKGARRKSARRTDFRTFLGTYFILESWAAIEVFEEANDSSTDEMIESAHRAESDERTAIPEIELYDSSASRHMSPHRQRFTIYRSSHQEKPNQRIASNW